jgi:hypothetical protein
MMEDISVDELRSAFAFLLVKVMDMELKTDDGHEICPMFGFSGCGDCEDCFLERATADIKLP